MKKSLFALLAASLSALTILASCQENLKNDDKKGEVADLFFSVENGDYCWYVAPDQSAEAELVIIRKNATDEAEYAIKVLDADEGIIVPETVSFAKDQTTATLVVKGPSVSEIPSSCSFELQFTGDNVNPSANSVEGTTRCEGTFYYYLVMESAACFLPDSNGGDIYNYLGDIRQTVWRISPSEFIFKNFLGSDYDLKAVIDPATGYVLSLIGGYDLSTKTDEWGGVSYIFYNEAVPEFEGNYYYEEFFPKGETRSLYNLWLYVSGNYSRFLEASETSSAQIFFTVPLAAFYLYDIDYYKEFQWQYLSFFFYPEDQLANCNFDTLPSVNAQTYPESAYVETAPEGYIPVQVYLENEAIDLDTQFGYLTENGSLLVPNFMLSDCSLEIITGTTSFDFVVRDTLGTVLSDSRTSTDSFTDFGFEYIYPWAAAADDEWCLYGLSAYNDAGYRVWNSASQTATFYGYYMIYDGDKKTWLTAQNGYVDIYW